MELAAEQTNTADPTLHDAGVYIAQLQFYQALNRLDSSDLSRTFLNRNSRSLSGALACPSMERRLYRRFRN